MITTAAVPTPQLSVAAAVAKFWGYTELKPLQDEAIGAGIEGRDSLVVLPTGGGKSLCYQVPPVVAGRTDVVVSPLISLMKDQVDGLRANGYQAAALHSGLTEQERSDVARSLLAGKLSLLFVSPERLLTPWFLSLAERAGVSSFAIDEAHCISQWGHDFRPEYRRLAELRQRFPRASIHAFTATATERVRSDIISQLELRKPRVLVGRFDRPNLTYRVVPRSDLDSQLLEAVRRHKDEAVIVYCISRKDTERVAELLKSVGVRAAAYHAGMDPRARARTQEAFARERLDVVVATVAFGMGIDRSNVRCVIHAAMPKSIEHYQQETGRAGRDGLEAECVLFHSNGDYRRWESLMLRSAADAEQASEVTRAQLQLIGEMNNFCSAQVCRHRALSAYFGQEYEASSCNACDVCLSEAPVLPGSSEIARKVIGCVQSLKVPFGVGYLVDVLMGSRSEKIELRRHDQSPSYGALASLGRAEVQRLVFQLVDRGLLHRSSGERPVLTVTPEGRKVQEGVAEAQLTASPVAVKERATRDEGWQGVDRGLFEALRGLRRTIADERAVPPFVIFGDAVLRDFARQRPMTTAALRGIRGVGEQKLADFGPRFAELIANYCGEHGLDNPPAGQRPPAPAAVQGSKAKAYHMLEQGHSLDEVAKATGRARSTVASYLEDYVAERQPESLDAWVRPQVYERVVSVASRQEGSFLRPVFEALEGAVSYEEIRVVMKHAGLR